MPSSISSSDPWRRFVRTFALTALAAGAIVYGFVVLVDPFDTLVFSPPFARPPIATNARFSFPALARSPRFDAVVLGTSTSRLLRPALLDPALDARFANLAMNSATAYEQSRLLDVFTRNHPDARAVLIGLDVEWCVTAGGLAATTSRPFPEWMYGTDRLAAYRHMFNLYAIEQSGIQFGVLTGIRSAPYGADGYTSFLPPDATYDVARAAAHLAQWGVSVPPGRHDGPPQTWVFPALDLLAPRLAALPAATRKLLIFVPYNHRLQPPPGDPAVPTWQQCKDRVAALARSVPGAEVLDFMIPSPITLADDNYWDGLHFREPIADRLVADITRRAHPEDFRVLAP